jgi:uracil-DNA glycosylase family 4
MVQRRLIAEAIASELFLVGQAFGRDTQRLSGLPYVFPGGPPHRLSKGGRVLDGWLGDLGHTIDPGAMPDRRYAYHTDLHSAFPGRNPSGSGDNVPSSADVSESAVWLQRELDIVQPRAIIALGKVPALELLGRYAGVHRSRLTETTGRVWTAHIGDREVALFTAYHPSGAFQFPAQSARAWSFVREALIPILAA